MLLRAPGPLNTDAKGQVEVKVEPREHVMALGVNVETQSSSHGAFYSTLPVVAGALRAEMTGHQLTVRAAVPLDHAYYAIQTERERWGGGGLMLSPDGRGGSVATVEVRDLPSSPAWVVVSTDGDLNSPATVGWPLGKLESLPVWPEARSVADRLLLDGAVAIRAAEARRRRRILWLTFAFLLTVASLSGVLLVRRVRAAERVLATHLARQLEAGTGPMDISRRNSLLAAALAVLCLALGFLLIALWVALRLG
jgi:hypothetical protein